MENNILPITLAIPTMNRPQTLKRTLESYLAADFLPAQIIIVDQSAEQETRKQNEQLLNIFPADVAKSYLYQEVPSLTKARNFALHNAEQEISVYSDDDIDVYKDTLKNVYDLFQNKDIAMIAGLDDCSLKSKTNIGYLLGTKSFAKRKIGHVTKSMLSRYPDTIKGEIPTEWAMGYFFAIRTILAKKWALTWDENLTSYAYAEDLDFSYSYYKHAEAEGLKSILSDKVHVKHLVSKEYRTPSKKATYMYVCHRYYLLCKHKEGLMGKAAFWYCNFWRFIERIIKKQQPKDMFDAMVYCFKNSKKIGKGGLNFPV